MHKNPSRKETLHILEIIMVEMLLNLASEKKQKKQKFSQRFQQNERVFIIPTPEGKR